jgi:hypothetical protein
VDGNVNEPSIDISNVVGIFFGNLQKYQHRELLHDLGVPGLSLKEFWQHGDKDYTELEYEKLLFQKQVHVNLPRIMGKFHELYYFACIYGLNFIETKIHGDMFKTSNFDLDVEIVELHNLYHLKMLNITMMTV